MTYGATCNIKMWCKMRIFTFEKDKKNIEISVKYNVM